MAINFCVHIFLYKHTQLYHYATTTIPREILQFFAYNIGAIWTKQHLKYTLVFKDQWVHDLYELTERCFITIYKFKTSEGNQTPIPLLKNPKWFDSSKNK